MNFRNPLIVAAAILFLGFATVMAFQALGIWGLILMTMLTLFLVTAIMFTFRRRAVLIDEMEVGVIFNRMNHSFSRFIIGPDPTPGQSRQLPSWIPFGGRTLAINDPHFIHLQWFEELTGTIPKKAQTAKGTLENIRTAEGVPISIDWKVSYTVDVTLIPEKLRHKMARALPEYSEKMVTGKVERALKHLVEIHTIQSLYEQGAIQELEADLCQRIYRQLSDPVNLGFKEFPPKDVSLGPITIPQKVESALELAHQRKIQTETVAGSLERLKRAIDGFSKEDMRRLSDLERLRILDDKDAGLLYLSDAYVRSESMKVKKVMNGRS